MRPVWEYEQQIEVRLNPKQSGTQLLPINGIDSVGERSQIRTAFSAKLPSCLQAHSTGAPAYGAFATNPILVFAR